MQRNLARPNTCCKGLPDCVTTNCTVPKPPKHLLAAFSVMAIQGDLLSYLVHQPSTLLMEGGTQASAAGLCQLQLPCRQLSLLNGLHRHNSNMKALQQRQDNFVGVWHTSSCSVSDTNTSQ